jgi:hypothetical protein
LYFEHSWLQWEWWEVPIKSDQNIYFSGKKESPLDSIVTNLGPSKYTHRSPSKI